MNYIKVSWASTCQWMMLLLSIILAFASCMSNAQSSTSSPMSANAITVNISQIVPTSKNTWPPEFDVYLSLRDVMGKSVNIDSLENFAVGPNSVIASYDSKPRRGNPISTLLIIDKSDSMMEKTDDGIVKLDAMKDGVRAFIQQMRPGDRCGIITFGSDVTPTNQITFYTKDDPRLLSSIDNIRPNNDVTVMYDAVMQAINYVHANRMVGRIPIILLTDGTNNIETTSGQRKGTLEGQNGLDKVINEAKRYHIRFDTIGIGKRSVQRPTPPSSSATLAERDQYFRALAQYLDQPTIELIASSTDGRSLITPRADELKLFYQQLLQDYQQEVVIHCIGQTDMGLSVDPGMWVACSQNGTQYKSNPVFLSYIVSIRPPIGSSAYPVYAQRRLIFFVAFLVCIIILWYLPKMKLGNVFGDGNTTQQAPTNQPSAQQAGGYWSQQAQPFTQNPYTTPAQQAPSGQQSQQSSPQPSNVVLPGVAQMPSGPPQQQAGVQIPQYQVPGSMQIPAPPTQQPQVPGSQQIPTMQTGAPASFPQPMPTGGPTMQPVTPPSQGVSGPSVGTPPPFPPQQAMAGSNVPSYSQPQIGPVGIPPQQGLPTPPPVLPNPNPIVGGLILPTAQPSGTPTAQIPPFAQQPMPAQAVPPPVPQPGTPIPSPGGFGSAGTQAAPNMAGQQLPPGVPQQQAMPGPTSGYPEGGVNILGGSPFSQEDLERGKKIK